MTMSVEYFELTSNMNRVCRICLTEGINMSPIFCTNQEIENFSSVSQKIQACGAIEIDARDGLPSLICDMCIYKANVAHQFREQCQHSDARLRLLYNKPSRSNVTDSSTQTELQRTVDTRKMENSTNYLIKQEMQGLNQELSSTMEVYTANSASVVPGNTIEADEKLFLCNIGFGESKELEKDQVILENRMDLTDNSCSIVDPQVAIVAMESVQHGLDETPGATITEMKTSHPAEQYITEHMLISSNVDADEDEAAADDDEDNEVDEVERELERVKEKLTIEDENMEKDETNDELPLPKRSTRKAKPSAGKSYSIDTNDEDSQDGDVEPKYKCKVCSKRYSTHKGLKNHSQVHDKNHKCPTCFKSFYKQENLEKHQKIHDTKPHACQQCHTSFAKPQGLMRHLKTHSAKEENNGDHNNSDDNVDSNQKAMKSEIDTDDDDEQDCSQMNDTREFNPVPGLYKCDICDQLCSTLKNLKRHAIVHGDKKYSCTVCKKWFFRPDTLKKHAEKHGHGLLDNLVDENKLYESDDESFNRRNSNTTSNDTTKKDDSDDEGASGEYKCQHCDKIMATKKGLRRHVSMHKPKAEPVSCEICKKVCASPARLALHQKTHNKPKEKVPREYLCHICSKVYPSNSSLTYHMRTHTGVKPHVCKTCNSGFTTTTSLANHIRIHTGDKPFVCHVCSAAFAVSSAFRRHLTRHTGEANYLCKTCGKAFKRLSTLKEHTYTHSGEKPYVCKTCGAAYSHSGSLFAHQKRCRAQYGEIVSEDHVTHVTHHIHVNNVQSAVRSLAVIGQMF